MMKEKGYLTEQFNKTEQKGYERLHDLAKQKQFKRLQLYQKYNPDDNLDFEKVNDILGSAQYMPRANFLSEHKKSATVAFGSNLDRNLIPKRDKSVDPELVNQIMGTDLIDPQPYHGRKMSVSKSDAKYNQLLAKKIQTNEKVAKMRQDILQKEIEDAEMLKNKNLMKKASIQRQQEVVNRFDQYQNKYQEKRLALISKYELEKEQKMGMLFHPKINRDYKPPRQVVQYSEEEYGPGEVEVRNIVSENSAEKIIYEDEQEQKSSSNRIKVTKLLKEN